MYNYRIELIADLTNNDITTIEKLYNDLLKDWHDFTTHPELYKNSWIIECIKQYIKEYK